MCKHPDTLTAEELSTYQPGWDCVCVYSNPKDCTCGANWTPREVYELRNMVLDLEDQLNRQKQLMIAAADNLDAVKKQRDDAELAKSDLEAVRDINERLGHYISGVEYAAGYLLNKETRRAMFTDARKYADDRMFGTTQYYTEPTTNYALEA
jgi:hypothetical protein